MTPYPCALCGVEILPTGKAGRPADRCPHCAHITRQLAKFRSALNVAGQLLPVAARNKLRAEVRSMLNATLN